MTSEDRREKEQQTVAKFLATRQVLLVDPKGSSRGGLYSVMHALGARAENITLTQSYVHAEQVLAEKRPQIVITEFDLGKQSGLELLQKHRQQEPEDSKNMIFVIVASNSSQSAVARAAEEDVDAYILKPYTPETVRKIILRAALMKVQPTEYYRLIDEAKSQIRSASFPEARDLLKKAMGKEVSPALAHFYLGQIDFIQDALKEAAVSFSNGLQVNRIHYKCMVGLYDCLMKQSQHQQAYEIMKRMSQYFPANPKRLTEVLKLAVACGRFDDIEKYYALFLNLEERDETLIKYVCAALVVCGKYYLSSNLGHSRAMELFNQAAATGYGRTPILKEIVFALLEQNLVREGEKFLEKFLPNTQGSLDYELCSFLVKHWEEDGPPFPYDRAKAFFAKGVHEEPLYTLTFRRSPGSKMLRDAIQELLEEACRKYPKKAEKFKELVKNKAG